MSSREYQKLTAHLKLPEYEETSSILNTRENFSVYEIKGESSILDAYSFDITFLSDDTINIDDIVDTSVELYIKDEQAPLNSKKIYGKVFKAKEKPNVARKKVYEITLVSPLHYLNLNQRYEIYQDKNVADIISEILNRYNDLLNIKIDVKVDLASIPTRHYTTQYEQSDFEFVKMLCEEEGFVLLFDYSTNNPFNITLCTLNEHATILSNPLECHYYESKKFATSNQIQDYYEKETPSLEYSMQLGDNANNLGDTQQSAQLRSDIKRYKLRDRLEELEESLYKDLTRYTKLDAQRGFAESKRIEGVSHELGLRDGISVRLEDKKVDKNIDAIILKAKYTAHFPNALDEYTISTKQDQEHSQYNVEFEAIEKDIIYIPQIKHQKQKISGLQTAIVSLNDKDTKKGANEIDVNEKGEIRVIFHFDEKKPTSCYIPLSNSFSGDGYGTQFLPRVNSEVIVSFINGDIDKPIIIGTLHNGENRHPYNLPKEKTQSFIKTQTTPQYEDKEGYNELLFEDKQGQEQLNLRAQRDYNLNVLNDSHTHIQNNEKTIIDADKELTVANDYTQTVGNDKRVNITGNQITTVEKEMLTTVKEDCRTNILKDSNTIINKTQTNIIEKDLSLKVEDKVSIYVEKDQKEKMLKSLFQKIEQSLGIETTNSYHLNAGTIRYEAQTVELVADDGVSLKVGGNVLTVDKSGIHLKAPVVDTASSNAGVVAPKIEMICVDVWKEAAKNGDSICLSCMLKGCEA